MAQKDALYSDAFKAGFAIGSQMADEMTKTTKTPQELSLFSRRRDPSVYRSMVPTPNPRVYNQQPPKPRTSCSILKDMGYGIYPVGGPTAPPSGPCKIDHFERRSVYVQDPRDRQVYLVPNFDVVCVTADGRKFAERDIDNAYQ